MSSRVSLSPLSAEFPTANYPAFKQDTAFNYYLEFSDSVDQNAYWSFPLPQGATGPYSLVVLYRMGTATTGNVVLQAAVEAVTPADVLNTITTSSFDTVNTSSTTAVPAAAGTLGSITISLTSMDSAEAGDRVRIRLNRDADNGADTASGFLEVLCADLRDAT